jgi:hypothetical protein
MPRRPVFFIASLLLRAYKLALSPVLAALGVRCRHTPGCSTYMLEAMRQHGVWAGGWMGLARLLRCQPWGTCGHDPVPDVLEGDWWRPWTYGRWR